MRESLSVRGIYVALDLLRRGTLFHFSGQQLPKEVNLLGRYRGSIDQDNRLLLSVVER